MILQMSANDGSTCKLCVVCSEHFLCMLFSCWVLKYDFFPWAAPCLPLNSHTLSSRSHVIFCYSLVWDFHFCSRMARNADVYHIFGLWMDIFDKRQCCRRKLYYISERKLLILWTRWWSFFIALAFNGIVDTLQCFCINPRAQAYSS